MKSGRLCLAGLTGLLLTAGLARAGEILYQNDFEIGQLGAEWSSGRSLVQEGEFTRFNGRYTNSSTVLTLGAAPPPGGKNAKNFGGAVGAGGFVGGIIWGGGSGGGGDDGGGDGGDDGTGRIFYTLEFDFYAIDSWDGDATEHGPDRFEVRVNGALLFSETFANTHLGQSFRRPDVGPEHLGFSPAWEDSIYRDIQVHFELAEGAESARIAFYAMGLQGMTDESWGIDNVSVSYDYRAVPAPGALSAGGLSLLLASRRRR